MTDLVVIFHFGPFSNPKKIFTARKIILKKWKKHLEISFYTHFTPKIMIICYTIPEMWHMVDVIVIFYFGLFFAILPTPPSPPLAPQKSKLQKKEKKMPRDVIIVLPVYQKL